MPTPPPPPTPAQQQAEQNMGHWLDQNNPVPTIPGPFGGIGQIGLTVQNLVAAAGAGAFAVSPDVGQRVIEQLTKVQDEAANLRRTVGDAAGDPQFGGGYAQQVGRFVQGVAAGQAGSAEEVLTKYLQELEQLKSAVAKSIANYRATDSSSAHGITRAGGQS